MIRSRLLLLAAIAAVGLTLVNDLHVRSVASPPAVSVRLTSAESDCVVGGEAGCFGVMTQTYGECVEAGFDPERPETAAVFVNCGAVGLWSGVVCAVNWLWDLIF